MNSKFINFILSALDIDKYCKNIDFNIQMKKKMVFMVRLAYVTQSSHMQIQYIGENKNFFQYII